MFFQVSLAAENITALIAGKVFFMTVLNVLCYILLRAIVVATYWALYLSWLVHMLSICVNYKLFLTICIKVTVVAFEVGDVQYGCIVVIKRF